MAPRFAHLHLHSQYSLLDGANRLDRLVARIRELGMDSVAVTDHGNLFGAVEFFLKAKKEGIKPILGIEAYVAPDVAGRVSDRTDKTYTGVSDGGFHLVLLAENDAGWKNLLRLSSDAYQNGFYYKPRMDKSTLAEWNDGLIAINGHLGSSIAFHLVNYVDGGDEKDWHLALAEARWHAETFPPGPDGQPRFYVELQRHIDKQEAINPHLVRLARELDLPLVCDNDSHFLLSEDWDSHDSLVCVATGKTKEDQERLKYPKELYVKSPGEMAELFGDYQDGAGLEALENTVRIAERCNVEIDLTQNHAPVVRVLRQELEAGQRPPEDEHRRGSTAWYKEFCSRYVLQPFLPDADSSQEEKDAIKADCDAALRELSEAGLVWRYGEDGITEEITARLDRELGILRDKDISSYFLIVWDFVNEARRRGIPANARGSGVGTMVGYCLGLSNACPVHYGLLFERFTDPDRSEYPDIDIDICQDGRGEILDYVREKYDEQSEGKVAQIITFNVLKAKAAIRDIGRVMEMPLPEVDKVCSMVGDQLNITLDEALDGNPELRGYYDGSPTARRWIDTARKIEGLTRHAGVHAAGVVLGNQPLPEVIPLAINKQGDREILVTQWDGPTCEKVGLLKMDFLGLRTLSIIEKARELVRLTLPEEAIRSVIDPEGEQPESWDPLDLDRLSYDDQKVLDLFRRGDTVGVFQFESEGMRRLLRSMAPDRLEDLIAANALYRPGPMALIDDYNNRKHGRAAVPEVHPIVDRFTEETYGIMVYQEQVMQIVHELGGIPLRAAYSLIKAISKKKEKTIAAEKSRFLEGAKEKGLSVKDGEKLFELILKFAGYGFNKSHSTGYAIVAYQTAYLKTYFPVQYMAAVLTYEAENTEKIVKYIDECRRVLRPGGEEGVAVRAPEINTSGVGFTPVFAEDEPQDSNHGYIRFGLSAVKGVGEKAVRAIIEVRNEEDAEPFASLFDFCERVPLRMVNRSTIEALIKCGAFDRVHGTESRAALLEALDGAIKQGQRAAKDRDSGQTNLFGVLADAEQEEEFPEMRLPDIEPWTTAEALRREKEALGFYVSSHPLNEHETKLKLLSNTCARDLPQLGDGCEVILGGLLNQVRKRITQRGASAGQPMAILAAEDASGPFEAVAFAETFARCGSLLREDQVVFLQGKLRKRDSSASILVDRVIPVERAYELTEALRIVLRRPRKEEWSQDPAETPEAPDAAEAAPGIETPGIAAAATEASEEEDDGAFVHRLEELRELLLNATSSNGGPSVGVKILLQEPDRLVTVGLNGLKVTLSSRLTDRIGQLLEGQGHCELVGGRKLRAAG